MTKSGYAGCWENVKENIMDKYNFKVTSDMVKKLNCTIRLKMLMPLIPKSSRR